MLDYDQIIEAVAHRIRGLKQPEFRIQKVCDDLVRFADHDIAHILQELYRGALRKQRHYVVILEALSHFDTLQDMLGERLKTIYELADSEKLFLAMEWLSPLPVKIKKPKGLEVHRDLQELTLGERRFLARKADKLNLEKLLVDPDPLVIRNLLNHPRILEHEVLKIASHQPNHPDVMMEIYRSRRWFSRMAVKSALVNNPATPPRIVMLILPWLPLQDIREIRKSKRFSEGFIDALIAERGGRGRVRKRKRKSASELRGGKPLLVEMESATEEEAEKLESLVMKDEGDPNLH